MSNYDFERVNIHHETAVADGATVEADKLKTLQTHNGKKVGLAIGMLIKAAFTATESDSGDAETFDFWQIFQAVTIKLKTLGMWCNNVPALQLYELYYGLRGWVPDAFLTTGLSTGAGDTAKTVYLPIMFATGPFFGHWSRLEGAIPLTEFAESAKVSVTHEWDIGADWSVKAGGTTFDIDLLVVWSDHMPEPVVRKFVVKEEAETACILDIDPSVGGVRLLHLFVSDDGDGAFDASVVTAASLLVDGRPAWYGVDGDDLDEATELFLHQHEYNYKALVSSGDAPEILTILSGAQKYPEHCELVERGAILKDMDGSHSGSIYVNQFLQYRPAQAIVDKIKRDCRVAEIDIQRSKLEERDTQYAGLSFTDQGVPMQALPPDRFRGTSPALIPVSE